jgi:hypothetical protein
VEGDARSFRVALVASDLVNAPPGRIDALALLEQEDWGVLQLPASDYPDEVVAPLLEQVAEQTEEFARHGYRLAIVGAHAGLDDALARRGVERLPRIDPSTSSELLDFLAEQAG